MGDSAMALTQLLFQETRKSGLFGVKGTKRKKDSE